MSLPGTQFNVLDKPGYYDDGGVGDLQLIIDLHDHTLIRIKKPAAYQTLLDNDELPKARRGPLKDVSRADQKAHLAQVREKRGRGTL